MFPKYSPTCHWHTFFFCVQSADNSNCKGINHPSFKNRRKSFLTKKVVLKDYFIGDLLGRAARGVYFNPDFASEVSKKIAKVVQLSGFERIICLQELLQKMARTAEYRLLAGELYHHDNINFTNFRLTKVMQFLNTNYQRKIELEKVAEIANLHPAAFCRFFKEKSGKPLSEYVNDLRIGYACRLINEGRMSISQISFESGFNNLSNFNRTFKKHTGFTPTRYSQEFQLQPGN